MCAASTGSLCRKGAQIFMIPIRLNRHLNESSTFEANLKMRHTSTRKGLSAAATRSTWAPKNHFFLLLSFQRIVRTQQKEKEVLNRRVHVTTKLADNVGS